MIHRNALKIKQAKRDLRSAIEQYRIANADPGAEASEAAQTVADLCVKIADLEAGQ